MALKDFKKVLEKVSKDHAASIVPANSNTLINKLAFDSPQLTYMFGGFSYDRIHNLFGPESSGKSSSFLFMSSQLQKKIPKIKPEWKEKQVVVYMDFERTFDPEYAQRLGLNIDEDHFVLLQSDTLEEACAITESLVKTGAVCCVILDSDAAAPTNLDAESEIGATGFNGAKAANTLKEVYKRFNVLCSNYKFPLLVVSQERAQMDVNSHAINSTGGRALRFFSSTRSRVQKLDTIKRGDETIGIQIRIRNYKNKTSIPFRDAIMDLYFDGGFDSTQEYFAFILNFGYIHRAGAWFDWTDKDNWAGEYDVENNAPKTYKWQGSAKVKEWLEQHQDVYSKFKELVDAKLCVANELDAGNTNPEEEESSADEEKLSKLLEQKKEEEEIINS